VEDAVTDSTSWSSRFLVRALALSLLAFGCGKPDYGIDEANSPSSHPRPTSADLTGEPDEMIV
jgi:hypothetical protein